MTRGILLPFVLATGALAQAPAAQPPPPKITNTVDLVATKAVTLSDTEKIALQAVLEERKQLGAKLAAIDSDVRRSHPGYHLEWGMDNVTLVKDVEPAKAAEPKK